MARKANPAYQTEKEIFPVRLRALMDRAPKTTQQTLADYIGITRQAVGHYQTGQSSPDWKILSKIAKFFNVSSDYLIGISDIQSQDKGVQAACSYLELPEESIGAIRRLIDIGEDFDYQEAHPEIARSFYDTACFPFNYLIQSPQLIPLLYALQKCLQFGWQPTDTETFVRYYTNDGGIKYDAGKLYGDVIQRAKENERNLALFEVQRIATNIAEAFIENAPLLLQAHNEAIQKDIENIKSRRTV